MPIIQRPAGALNLREDIAGFCGPDERFRCGVVVVDIFVNGSNQIVDTAKDAATDAFGREVAEESLDHIEPRTAGWREVHVDARMSLQPALDFGVFVGSVVIGDEVKFLGLWIEFVNHPQEAKPFLMAVPVVAHADDSAVQGAQGRK